MNSLVAIHPQVLQALHDKQPVVALESAIISHGMSYPKNVETALCVEDVIRKHGVVPATVAPPPDQDRPAATGGDRR